MSEKDGLDAGIAIPIVFVVLGCPCLLLLLCYALDRILVQLGGPRGCAWRHTLLVWCCLRDDPRRRAPARPILTRDPAALSPAHHPLPPAGPEPSIDEFEGVTRFDGPDGVCAVCLEFLKDQASWELSCGHPFHRLCIIGWLAKKRTCPVCRKAQYLHIGPAPGA